MLEALSQPWSGVGVGRGCTKGQSSYRGRGGGGLDSSATGAVEMQRGTQRQPVGQALIGGRGDFDRELLGLTALPCAALRFLALPCTSLRSCTFEATRPSKAAAACRCRASLSASASRARPLVITPALYGVHSTLNTLHPTPRFFFASSSLRSPSLPFAPLRSPSLPFAAFLHGLAPWVGCTRLACHPASTKFLLPVIFAAIIPSRSLGLHAAAG